MIRIPAARRAGQIAAICDMMSVINKLINIPCFGST